MQKDKFAQYLANMELSVDSNLKPFWNFVKNKRKSGSIPSHFCIDNCTVTNSHDIAENMNSFFESVFTAYDTPSSLDEKQLPVILDQFCNLEVSIDDVKSVINNLDTLKASGPDSLLALLLKNCSEELSFPLTSLFN